MKISNKIFLILAIFLFNCNLSYASSINNVTVLDEYNINLDISSDVNLNEGKVDSEVKIMKDIDITFISRDFEDKNKLILNLSSDLKENSTYSLITILGPELGSKGNMEFNTSIGLDDKEILNTELLEANSQGIKRLLIVNSSTIELYFNNLIEEDELEFKLFNELNVNKIESSIGNKLNINLIDKLDKSSNYILMFLFLSDNYGNYVNLDEDYFDIITPKVFINDINNISNMDNAEDQIDIMKSQRDIIDNSVEDFALNSAETPDTGPETTVLIVLTFILNTVFILRKKFIKK